MPYTLSSKISLMIERLTKIAGISFAVFWMLFIVLEYWQYHDSSRRAIALFQFPELALLLLALGAAFVFAYLRFREGKFFSRLSNGLGILLFAVLLLLICLNAYFQKNLGQMLNLEENLSFISSILGVALATYLILLTAYGVGNLLVKLFGLNLSKDVRTLSAIGIGILAIVTMLFVLGAFGLLTGWLLWPLFGILIATSWRSVLQFIQLTFWHPIPAVQKINAVGLSAFYLLLIFISMNFAQVVRPFPIGFDAITYYVNISSLISEYGGLVSGYGAYNWSLFMSLGFILFDKTAIVLSLSFGGGILALLVLYQLSRRWLDVNYSLIVVLLFYTLPMISWLSYRDMKVDMGLLFYALLIVLLSIDWLAPTAKKSKKKKENGPKSKKTSKANGVAPPVLLTKLRQWIDERQLPVLEGYSQLVVIGLLLGFSAGIKLSALIILLAFLPILAYTHGNQLAFGASLCVVLFLVLLARFDAQAALRPLHLWADQLQWFIGAIGLGLLTFLFLKQREVFFRVLKSTTICVLFFGLTLGPWLVKNAIETKSISLTDVTRGQNVSPSPSIQDIRKAYEDARNNQ